MPDIPDPAPLGGAIRRYDRLLRRFYDLEARAEAVDRRLDVAGRRMNRALKAAAAGSPQAIAVVFGDKVYVSTPAGGKGDRDIDIIDIIDKFDA